VARHLEAPLIRGKRVLEVGACDVNGSVRPVVRLLDPAAYVGVDIAPGPGVDVVCRAEQLVECFGAASFDAVISVATFEHIREWRPALSNLKRVCKPGGLILFIVPSVWHYHEHPFDFWRFSLEDVERLFADCDLRVIEEDTARPSLVYAKFIKPHDFREADLTEYALYSVLVGKKVPDVTDRHLQAFHARRLIFFERLRSRLVRTARALHLSLRG
jgi:SAM-dependent methyltransferase